MTADEDYAACRPIRAELRAIADRTYLMARALRAEPSNPDFVSTMDRQAALLKRLGELDDQMLNRRRRSQLRQEQMVLQAQ